MDYMVPQQFWTGVTPRVPSFAQTTYDQGFLPSKREINSPFMTEDSCLYKLKDEVDNPTELSFEQTLSDGVLSDCDKDGRCCVVCGEKASGYYFGALVCLPCKSFYIRCTKDGEPAFTCQCNGNCDIAKQGRIRCQYCRYRRCLMAGMCRKEKPETVQPAEGQVLCKVCGDIANGVHFGVNTCEGCKKFFRRGLVENISYTCKGNKECTINPRNRNNCRYCRYQKCLQAGMSREAIKMGRPKKCETSECNSDNSPKRSSGSPANRFSSPQPETVFFDHTTASPSTDYSSACSSPRDTSELNEHIRDNEDLPLHKRTKPIDIKREDGGWGCQVDNCMLGQFYNKQFTSCKQQCVSPPNCATDSRISGEWSPASVNGYPSAQNFSNSSYQASCSYQSNSLPMYNDGVPFTCARQTTLPTCNNQTTGFSSQTFNPRKRQYEHVDQSNDECIMDYMKANESGSFPQVYNSCSISNPCYQVPVQNNYSQGNVYQGSPSCSLRSYECDSGASSPLSTMSISPQHTQEFQSNFNTIPVYGPSNFSSSTDCDVAKTSEYKWVSNTRRSVLNIQLIERINHAFANPEAVQCGFDDATFLSSNGCYDGTLNMILDKTAASALLQISSPCPSVPSSNSQYNGYNTMESQPLNRLYKSNISEFHTNLTDCCLSGAAGFKCENYSESLSRSYWAQPMQAHFGLVNCNDSKAIINQILNAYTLYVDGCSSVSSSISQNPQFEDLAQNISMHTNYFVKFVSSIPGFCELHQADRLLLTKNGAIQCGLLMAMTEYYDVMLKSFPHWLDNLMQSCNSFYQLRLSLMQLAEQVHALNLDKVETAMLCVLMVTSSDWLTLGDKNTIELLRNRLLSAFQIYLTEKCADHGVRTAEIFAIISRLRHIGVWYKQMLKCIRLTNEANTQQSCVEQVYNPDYTMPCTTLRCG
ncbi:hypothetical protein ScPMuIL_014906 [Solemya velum]